MPPFPQDRFVDAVKQVVKANEGYVPPYGSGATLYIRPYMFGSDAVIGVKPANEYQFRIFCTPVGPYFKGGAKPITIRVSDYDRAAPNGTGHIKAGLNYAMSLHAIVEAHEQGYAENTYKGRGDWRCKLPVCNKGWKGCYTKVKHDPSIYHTSLSRICCKGIFRT